MVHFIQPGTSRWLLLKDQPDDNHKKNHVALTLILASPSLPNPPSHTWDERGVNRKNAKMEILNHFTPNLDINFLNDLGWVTLLPPALSSHLRKRGEFSWLDSKVFLAPDCRDTQGRLTCLLAIALPGTRPWGFPRVGSAPGPDTSSLPLSWWHFSDAHFPCL